MRYNDESNYNMRVFKQNTINILVDSKLERYYENIRGKLELEINLTSVLKLLFI